MVVINEVISNGKLMLTDEILNDERVFKMWFINTYLSKFKKLPDLDSFELSNRVRLPNMTLEDYFQEVSHFVSMSLYGEDISKRVFEGSRKKEICQITKITCYILVDKLRFTKCSVAKVLGKNHATVIHHSKTVEGYLLVDKEFTVKMEEILFTLRKRGLVL